MDEALREVGVTAPPHLLGELCELAFGRFDSALDVDPRTKVTLADLRERGLRLGCVTNTVLSDEQIRRALAEAELLQHLDSLVVSAEMGSSRTARVERVSKAPLHQLTTLLHEPPASVASDASAIGIDR